MYAAGGLSGRSLKVAYSDGKTSNQLDQRTVFLDPNVVTNTREGYGYDEVNDVLCGAALLGANSKLTADADTFNSATKLEDEWVKRMYYGSEFQAADARVDAEAPGLGTYLDARGGYYLTPEVASELSGAAADPQTSSDVACALLSNLLMHREAANAVERGVYDEAVREAYGRLAQCAGSSARLSEAKNLREWFKELFDVEQEPPPPPPPCGGESEDEQDAKPEDQDEQEGGQEGEDEQDAQPDEGDQDGEGEPELSDEGEPVKLGLTGEAIDKELSLIQGDAVEVELKDGGSMDDVMAVCGEGQALEEGEDEPANGWGDQAEPWSVRVVDTPKRAGYESMVAELQPQIRVLVNKLQFTTQTPHVQEYGYLSGDLDEGGIEKLFLGDRHPAVFMQTEVFERPPIAVGLMVDESGSMNSSEKYIQARKVATMLAEALAQVPGVRIRIWGHSSEGYHQDCTVYEYITATNGGLAGRSKLAGISARGENYDGAALGYAAEQLNLHDADCDRRILFCISDGMPSGGTDGVTYNRFKAEQARRSGVEVYGIGVAGAYNETRGAELFGPNMFCVLSDVASAGSVISSFIVRMVNRRV